MQNEINGKRTNEQIINETEAISLYEKEHPEYVDLKNRINSLMERKDIFEKEIKRRKKFHEILAKCQKRIDKYIQAA